MNDSDIINQLSLCSKLREEVKSRLGPARERNPREAKYTRLHDGTATQAWDATKDKLGRNKDKTAKADFRRFKSGLRGLSPALGRMERAVKAGSSQDVLLDAAKNASQIIDRYTRKMLADNEFYRSPEAASVMGFFENTLVEIVLLFSDPPPGQATAAAPRRQDSANEAPASTPAQSSAGSSGASSGDESASPSGGDSSGQEGVTINRDEVRREVAMYVSTQKGSCGEEAPRVKKKLQDEFGDQQGIVITGISVAWWDKKQWIPSLKTYGTYNHTAAGYRKNGVTYIVDTTEGQFRGGRDGVIIEERDKWLKDLLALTDGAGPKVKNYVMNSGQLGLFLPEHADMPAPPAQAHQATTRTGDGPARKKKRGLRKLFNRAR